MHNSGHSTILRAAPLYPHTSTYYAGDVLILRARTVEMQRTKLKYADNSTADSRSIVYSAAWFSAEITVFCISTV